MATLADRVLGTLRASDGLDDDVLAQRHGVARQQINQVCRRLADRGVLRRLPGPDGKIVNLLVAEAGGAPERASVLLPAVVRPSERVSEDEVKAAMKDHLEAQGYEVVVAWGRERGIDIVAKRGDERLVVEAKGEAPAGPQQVNYFLGALGELVQRMDDADAGYGLALPDHRQYRGLVERLPKFVRDRLRLRVWFVARTSKGLRVREDAD